tara:strand:+ start:1444 stop:1656 length:213 start_codon:yes stop_codon:yes gene_type:complete
MNVVEMNQVLKTQRIRLIDVFVLGPLMIHAGTLIPKKHKSVRFSLMMFGATTIVYNGMNWHIINKSLKNG